jgi:phage gpG-like protein
MAFSAHITENSLDPGLAQMARQASDMRPLLQAMGLQLVSQSKRAFSDSSLRAAPWPPKRDGSAATLRQSGALWHSIRITGLSASEVMVGSDQPHAAIHQFGGRIHAKPGGQLRFAVGDRVVFAKYVDIPPRPYLPVLNGSLTDRAYAALDAVGLAKLKTMLPGAI